MKAKKGNLGGEKRVTGGGIGAKFVKCGEGLL